VPALAIMLGANVGTTLIVQVLSFNIAAVAPVLFIIGLVVFRSGPRSRLKDMGRVSIGLGLMLLALHILLDWRRPRMRRVLGSSWTPSLAIPCSALSSARL
jgi:phosphate:Na+ symporter